MLYANQGDGTFRWYGWVHAEGMFTSAALADLNRDGNLDFYACNYITQHQLCKRNSGEPVVCHPNAFVGTPDVLYLNRGDGSFVDITQESGVGPDQGRGLGVLVADFDADGWPDIFIANDTNPNFLFHNQKALGNDGTPLSPKFRERGVESGCGLGGNGRAQAGMGIAFADFDCNGWPDIHVTNLFGELAVPQF